MLIPESKSNLGRSKPFRRTRKLKRLSRIKGTSKNGNEPMKDQGIKPSDDVKKFKDEHAMASNQGEDATQTFIHILNGEFTVAKDAKTANRDGAWEHAKDCRARCHRRGAECRQYREGQRDIATDNCKDHSMGGHP
jgi:hypothetical protein